MPYCGTHPWDQLSDQSRCLEKASCLREAVCASLGLEYLAMQDNKEFVEAEHVSVLAANQDLQVATSGCLCADAHLHTACLQYSVTA